MKVWMYKWLPIIFGCHCRDDRSFHFHGQKFPICARCTGELVGSIVSLFSCLFFRCSVTVSVIMLLPMIGDGFIQALTKYESNNIKRFITGFLFGYGLCMLFVVSSIGAYNIGQSIAEYM